MVAIATDRSKRLRRFATEGGFPFPLVSDRTMKITKAYGVYTAGKFTDWLFGKFKLAVPSTYLLDREGRVFWVHVGTREVRPSTSQIAARVHSMLQRG